MITLASFTLADGAWIFAGFLVAFFVAITHGYYSRRGSAINQRAHGGVYSNAPGAKSPSVLSHDQSAAGRLVRRDKPSEPRRSPSQKAPASPPRKRRPAKQN